MDAIDAKEGFVQWYKTSLIATCFPRRIYEFRRSPGLAKPIPLRTKVGHFLTLGEVKIVMIEPEPFF